MKPGPKPKPAHLKKLRRSFRLSQSTVDLIEKAKRDKSAESMTEAIEVAVEAWWGV